MVMASGMGAERGLDPVTRALCAEGVTVPVVLGAPFVPMHAGSLVQLSRLAVARVACWGALEKLFVG